jgi:enoyl-CoA hydratase
MKLEYRTDGSLGWITLSNPPYNNLTHPVFADQNHLTEFLASPDLKAVILKGKGRHFCGGADLDVLRAQMENPDALADAMNHGKSLLKAVAFAPIPLLAMVKGSCLGGGLEIALACHFRFASENAMFGFPEAENALMPAFGGSVFTNNVVSRQSVIDLMLSGRMVRSNEALEIGLIDRVLPTSKLETAATKFLGSLTDERSPTLIRSVMESIHNGRRLSIDEALRRETELFCRVLRDSRDQGSADE